MFTGSPGSISQTLYTVTFASRAALKSAVVAYLKLSPKGDCPDGPHGAIGEWDVTRVAEMDKIFDNANSFNGGISKWDLSSVVTMSGMFAGATLFNGNLSKWDVSSVVDMSAMFWRAAAFNGDISKWDVSSVTTMGSMFTLSLIHI